MLTNTENIRQLQNWYRQPLGEELANQEEGQLERVLQGLFGYHLAQLGQVNSHDLLKASPINHKFIMGINHDDVNQDVSGEIHLCQRLRRLDRGDSGGAESRVKVDRVGRGDNHQA